MTSSTHSERQKRFFGFTIPELTTAIIALGGIVLSFLGKVSQEIYLKSMGIQPDLFPKAFDWNLVQGYYVISERNFYAWSTILHDTEVFLWFSGVIVIFSLYLFMIHLLNKLPSRKEPPKWMTALIKRIPDWLKNLIATVFFALTTSVFIPIVLMLITLLLIIPFEIAKSQGQTQATKDIQIFQEGCVNAVKKNKKCVEIKKKNDFFQSFLIDSSETHVALYDVNLKKIRVLDLNDVEISTLPIIPDKSL